MLPSLVVLGAFFVMLPLRLLKSAVSSVLHGASHHSGGNPNAHQQDISRASSQRRLASTAASPARLPREYPVNAARQPHLVLRRLHWFFCRLLQFHGAMPATEACSSSAVPLSHDAGACALNATPPATGVRALRVDPRSHVTMPATRACGSGATPLSQGTGDRASSAAPSATGACTSSAAPIIYGIIQATEARASSPAPPSQAPHIRKLNAPARRSVQRGCPFPVSYTHLTLPTIYSV